MAVKLACLVLTSGCLYMSLRIGGKLLSWIVFFQLFSVLVSVLGSPDLGILVTAASLLPYLFLVSREQPNWMLRILAYLVAPCIILSFLSDVLALPNLFLIQAIITTPIACFVVSLFHLGETRKYIWSIPFYASISLLNLNIF